MLARKRVSLLILKAILPALLALASGSRALAVTFFVNGASANCSDTGPGTAAIPYCTISMAVNDRSGPGVTLTVSPAVYREQVTITNPGVAGNPFVIQASGTSPVIVDGADDFSGTANWTLLSGNVYLASGVTWGPLQVFSDGARLTPAVSTTLPASLVTNSFVWVSGQGLYANLGGTNPGLHVLLVGHRLHGFRLSGRPWVNIDGFTVLHTEDRSFYLTSASSNCEITNNIVSLSNKFGIAVTASANVLAQGNVVSYGNDHGIYLTTGATGCIIQDNESFGHARPDIRAANGIQLNGSSGNIVQRNRLHDNQDTGLQINTSSNNNLSIQNRSWNNGDHGYDHLNSTGSVHIGDVAYKNFKDGFSIEGNCINTTVVDSIAIDNGLTTAEFNLWCDSTSAAGLVSNYNIFWNSNGQAPIKRISTIYSTIAAFTAATGLDANSIQANPRFVNAAAGDFHLLSASPAIDSADSSVANWPVTDAAGNVRLDDPNVPNAGKGPPVTYADRGALEFDSASAPNLAPNGVIDTPSGGLAIIVGQSVAFTGTGTDPDNNLPLSFQWNFGGGAANRSVKDPGSVQFLTPGTYTVTFTVFDGFGKPDPTPDSRVITVNANQAPNGVIDTPAASITVTAGLSAAFLGTGTDLDGNTPLTYSWNFGGGAANSTAQNPGTVLFATPGTYTVTFTVTDSLGLPDPTPGTRVVTVNPNQAPNGVIDSPAGSLFAAQNGFVSFQATGIDLDGTFPLAYSWNFGGGGTPSTSTLEDPGLVQFKTLGTFTVSFTVKDALNLADPTPDTRVVTVEVSPNGAIMTPSATPNPWSIRVGQSVNFSGTVSSGTTPPFSFHWDFGGGAPGSTAQNPGLTAFGAPGTYTVNFTVIDNHGLADPTPSQRTILVNPNQPPNGTIGTPLADRTILVGQSVSFTGSGTDPENDAPLAYQWDFGGGAPNTTLQNPGSVTFPTAGTFTVTFTVRDSLGAADPAPDSRIVVVNAEPNGVINSPAAGAVTTITAGENVSFTGTGTDPDGNAPLTYLWNFGGGAANSTVQNPGSIVFSTPGTYTVSFVVADSRGTPDPTPDSRVITVNANQAPNGVIDTPGGNVAITSGDSVDFMGTGSDPDGNLPLSFQWDFGGGAANSTAEDPGPVAFTTVGTYTVTFTVTDRLGLADPTPYQRVITVTPNHAPVGSIDAPAGDTLFLLGQSPNFASTGSDQDGNLPLSFAWNFGGGAPNSTVEDPGPVTFATPGTFTVTLTVTDSLGMPQATPATRVITVNQEPNGTIDTPAGSITTITEGESVSFTGTGTDPDGNTPLAYQWNFGGGAPNSTVEDPGSATFTTPGTYTVTFTVSDGRGTPDPTPDSRVITVNPNQAPDGVINTPGGNVGITAGDGVNFTGTASDPDNNLPLAFLWDFGGGAANSTVEDPGRVAFVTPGTYTVTFTVTDRLGLADPTPHQRVITVAPNAQPNGTIDSPASAEASVSPGDTLSFTGTGSDPDGNLPLTYVWDFGGAAAGSTLEDPGAVLFTTLGDYTVTFTVADSFGLADPTPDTRIVHVVPNQAPNGTIDLPATDATIVSGQSVLFQGTAADPDGHTPLSYLWNFGGGATNSSVEDPGAITFAAPGTYTVTFTATDRLGLADPTPGSRVITVLNQAPNGTIDSPAGPVTSIFEGQTVNFQGTATDPDASTPLTYSWNFGAGGPAGSAVEDPGLVSFPVAGSYTVTFTVTDRLGLADPTPDQRTLVVQPNHAPNGAIDTPTVDTSIIAGQSVVFAATCADPDGQALAFSWNFGGGAASSTVEDPGAITFATAGTYTVTLTVTDVLGKPDPSPDTRVITVAPNQAPNGTIDVPPGDLLIGAGQSVSFAGTASDPDGTTPLTFLWNFGGGAANSTVEDPGPVAFNTPGTFTVTFTVTDALGLADPTPDTRVITVNAAPNGTIDAPAGNATITAGQSVSFSGSGSDPDGNTPLAFLWNFGGGATNSTIQNPGAVTFATPGSYTVTLTVSDSLSLADPTPATRVITVNANQAPNGTIGTPVAATTTITLGQSVSFSGSGIDPDANTPLAFAWNFGGGAANSTVQNPGLVTFNTPGTFTVTFTVTDSLGLADPTPDSRVIRVNQAPNGTIATPAANTTITAGQSVSFTGTGTDPDANTPLTFAWNFGGGAASSTAQNPGAVTFSTAGIFTVSLTVTDSLGLADPTPATRVITVNAAVGANLVGNPSFETNLTGWTTYGGDTIARVAGGQAGAFALEMRGPASLVDFGTNDTPNWVATTPAIGTRYRVSAWVRAATSRGKSKIRVREYLSGVQVGVTTYSTALTLSATWQLVTVDYITARAGSMLDVQVLDTPIANSEIFQTDNIAIQTVP